MRTWSLLVLAACEPTTVSGTVPEPTPAPVAPTVRRQLCLYGATQVTDGANPVFDDLCEALPDPLRNPVEDIAGFRIFELDDARAAMLTALDTDGDGLVTDADEAIVDVLGYSWGGVNALQLALHEEPGVTATRPLIGRVAVIDPFVPPHDEPIVLGGPVEQVWSYGHSESPSWDCSALAPLGPYRSRPIDCGSTDAPCAEYDLSRDRVVGHCTIVLEAGDWALENVVDGTSPAPETLRR
jgi:pimeloyl-ACP methyl ester carboxylesterase